jgi:DNA-binding GntR family transcriptional regulator
MVSYAGNQKLISLYRKLTRELSLFRRRNFSDHALLVTSVNEHRDILEAIGSRNGVKAAEALRQHVLMSRERTIRNYVKYSERAAP